MLKQMSQESHTGTQPFRLEEESAIYRGRLCSPRAPVKTIYKGNPVLLVENEFLYKKLHQN